METRAKAFKSRAQWVKIQNIQENQYSPANPLLPVMNQKYSRK